MDTTEQQTTNAVHGKLCNSTRGANHQQSQFHFHLHTSRANKFYQYRFLNVQIPFRFMTDRPANGKRKEPLSACIHTAPCLTQRRSPEYAPFESLTYLMNSLHEGVPLLTQSFSRNETMGHMRHNKHLTGMKFFLGSGETGNNNFRRHFAHLRHQLLTFPLLAS